MSKKRYLDTRFWDDSYIGTLDPSEKLVYLYLLTNPLTTICGVYEITVRRICNDTGYNQDTVEKILGRFERDNKVRYLNHWLAIKNFIKHQTTESPKVRRGIELALAEAPSELAKWVLGDDRVSIPYVYGSNYSDSDSDSDSENILNNDTTPDSVESDTPPPISLKQKKDKLLGTEAKECLDYYFQKHKEIREFEPTIDGPRDMAIFKRLLAGYSVKAVKQVMDFFFAYKGRSKFTTRALYNSFDTLYGVMLDKRKGKRK